MADGEIEFRKEYSALMKKIANLRGKVIECKWELDGNMKIAGNLVKYIKLSQMKANLAPLFNEVGLEFAPTMSSLPIFNNENRQWLVPMEFEIIDPDTGCHKVYSYAGSGDGAKGIAIGQAYALKMFIGSVFLITDGLDPDSAGVPQGSSYVPKTPVEKEEMISKINSNPTVNRPVKETVNANPMTGVPTEVVAPVTSGKPMSKMQSRSIANILEVNDTRVESGEMTAEERDKIKALAAKVATVDEAKEFITTYKVS